MFENAPLPGDPNRPSQPETVYELEKDLESSPEELIFVMPTKFKKGKKIEPSRIPVPQKSPRGKIVLVLIIIFICVAIVAGGIGFYLWAKDYIKQPKKSQLPIQQTPVTQQPAESPQLSLSASIIDNTNQETVSSADLFFPTGALKGDKVFQFVGTFQPAGISTATYQYLGGIYKIGPETPILKKTATLRITYISKLVQPSWEAKIKLAYLKDNVWNILPSQIDVNTKAVSANLEVFPSDTIALVIEQTELQPKNGDVQIAPQIASSQDQDNDSLTDLEEQQVYQTNPTNPDTDGDGQPDGLEVSNLSDPLHRDGTLSASGLVKVFTNDNRSYSLFYPANWLVKPLPETDMSQVMIITNTGEFFEVSVEENTERLTPREWYLKQSAQIRPEEIADATVANKAAVWSADRLNLYVGRDDKIYILTYNLGTEEETTEKANFKTTFRMMIKSFQFLGGAGETMPEGKHRGDRPDGALIKYPDATSVYLLEGGKKRPIKSEDVYIRLGYQKWNIVEIPLDEWYPDGEMIE